MYEILTLKSPRTVSSGANTVLKDPLLSTKDLSDTEVSSNLNWTQPSALYKIPR